MSETRPLVAVPSERASLEEVFDFSRTYDGYVSYGMVSGTSRFFDDAIETWRAGRPLDTFDLDTLRAALFLAHRSRRSSGDWPEDESDYQFERALVEAIRDVSGGFVEDQRAIMAGAASPVRVP